MIDADAKRRIDAHVEKARAEGRVLKDLAVQGPGHFVGPAVIRLEGIHQLTEEIFGPVLHVATYRADEMDAVIDAINATGYGLTFGMHSRIDDRVQSVAERVDAGNLYVNRNQIGAIVGSQPFGGHGLSGTGPKAGGPAYLPRFCRAPAGIAAADAADGASADAARVQAALDAARPDTASATRSPCRDPLANRTACPPIRGAPSCALAREPRRRAIRRGRRARPAAPPSW